MKVRWLSIALVFALLLGAVVAPVSAQEQTGGYTVRVTGSAPSFLGSTFSGTLTLTSFDRQGSTLVVNGLLVGTVSDADSTVIGNIRRTAITLTTTSIRASCERLSLELVLLDPKASGLDITLDPVALDISAKTDASEQLGNLMCAVSRLLGNNAPPAGIANLLNQILRILG